MLRKFQEQLEKLKKRLLKMGSSVEEQLNYTIQAILEENEEKAQRVFELEKTVDKIDLKIEKNCQKLFALNQPVALDLRLIISAINLSTDLERIGDLSVNISELFLKTKRKPEFIDEIKFNEMSTCALKMYKDALDSFINNDAEKAREVIKDDKILDELKCY
ncbi:MAG: phosphate signaling complex protein PhoU [Melioribacteraceae bacterium]|nr:phosphate signaling complex protein PhoU [Melioribacteraceae bacterium]